MQLKYCSITGADDAVDPADLAALSQEYPFAEWAVLWLPDRAGTPRFPQKAWIKKFAEVCGATNKAMHLCGQGLIDFIDGKDEVLDLMSGVARVQLNLKFGDVEGKYDPQKLVERVRQSPQWEFIIQYGRDKQGLLPLLKDAPNHAVLFDESAGRGISPDSWDEPLPGHFCGYAGGMKPENIDKNLTLIAEVAKGRTTWIDMETGVRTDDRFDLTRVIPVLKAAAAYAE